MGEIADYLVEQMVLGRTRKTFRRLEAVTCKRCGATGLFWGKFRGKMVLRNYDTTEHVCPPSLAGFEDLDR